jgi:hypothetical protein
MNLVSPLQSKKKLVDVDRDLTADPLLAKQA